MNRILAAASLAALTGCSSLAVAEEIMSMDVPIAMGNPYLIDRTRLEPGCITIDNVLKLCPNPPTIWMAPDVEPREIAERFVKALEMAGYKVKAEAK